MHKRIWLTADAQGFASTPVDCCIQVGESHRIWQRETEVSGVTKAEHHSL